MDGALELSNPRADRRMTTPKRVLLVEDDADIAEIVALHLRDEGYAVEHAVDGTAGLKQLESQAWDAIVLDLMLPGVDGLEVCRRARSMERYTPIIITSARGSEVHRVLGLEIGADDYLAKPFSVLELVARVRALLRRVDALARSRPETAAVHVADLAVFPLEREVKIAGKRVDLTPREFDLLYFFVSHPGKVFSRGELLDRVWGHRHDGYEHTVNTHINRIRAKIEADSAKPRRILTVWGRGYKLSAEENET
jgi:DNA-binding response OmpR family regulator